MHSVCSHRKVYQLTASIFILKEYEGSSSLVLNLNSLFTKKDLRVNMMFSIKYVLLVLPIWIFAIVLCGPVNHLDVFIARRELKRFSHGMVAF